jgi:tRNA pseudouridine38-40 synthase
MTDVKRYALGVEYDGSRFLGWQSQAQTPTVQDALEAALAAVANEFIRVHASGRTDTGVHAGGQVVHFDSAADRSTRSWILGCNSNLPPDVAVIWCRSVSDTFDSRRSAVGRDYRYRIANRWIRPALHRAQTAWIKEPLNAALMHEAAQALLGEHDFTSFRSINCQARHAVRRLTRISVSRREDEIHVDVAGNAFLHHMVRNIVGTLVEVGKGEREPQWVSDVLEARDRSVAGMTAPASGLCLMGVRYPESLQIPREPDSASLHR